PSHKACGFVCFGYVSAPSSLVWGHFSTPPCSRIGTERRTFPTRDRRLETTGQGWHKRPRQRRRPWRTLVATRCPAMPSPRGPETSRRRKASSPDGNRHHVDVPFLSDNERCRRDGLSIVRVSARRADRHGSSRGADRRARCTPCWGLLNDREKNPPGADPQRLDIPLE